MEDFDSYFLKNVTYPMSKQTLSFPAQREQAYQRKTAKYRESLLKGILLANTVMYTVFSLIEWISSGWILRLFNIMVISVTVTMIIRKCDLLQPKQTKRVAARAPSKNKKPDASSKIELITLISLAELMNMGRQQSAEGWLLHTVWTILAHTALMSTYDEEKDNIRARIALRVLGCFLSYALGWKVMLAQIVLAIASYLLIVNAVYHLHRLIKMVYLENDILRRYFNQFFDSLDSFPYPIVMFDEKFDPESEGKRSLPIVFFNVLGSELLKRVESRKTAAEGTNPSGVEDLVQFLDFIDPHDESQLIDIMDFLKRSPLGSKQSFTTDLPIDMFEHKQIRRMDITVWKTQWTDREVFVAMFNSDNFQPTKGVSGNRFSSKYLEGLVSLLDKTNDFGDTLVSSIKAVATGQSDQKALYENVTTQLSEIMNRKLLVDNCIIFEPYVQADALKSFNPKAMIVNVADMVSRGLNEKEISLTVVFTQDFPTSIKAKFGLVRAFFFDLLKYFEVKMSRGKIVLVCDTEKISASPDNPAEDIINLKFSLEVRTPRDADLPSSEFLSTSNTMIEPLTESKTFEKPPLDNIIFWLQKLRTSLGIQFREELVCLKSESNSPATKWP